MKLVELSWSQNCDPCFPPQNSHECKNMHGGLAQGAPWAYRKQYFLLGAVLLLLEVCEGRKLFGGGREFQDWLVVVVGRSCCDSCWVYGNSCCDKADAKEFALSLSLVLTRHDFSLWPGVLHFSQIGNGLFMRCLFLSSSHSRLQIHVFSVYGMLRSLCSVSLKSLSYLKQASNLYLLTCWTIIV